MEKPVYERSPEALSQDGRTMRFSDEVSAAEVARLIEHVRRTLAVASGYGDVLGDESGTPGK